MYYPSTAIKINESQKGLHPNNKSTIQTIFPVHKYQPASSKHTTKIRESP